MEFSVQQIADLLEGSVEGNKDAMVSSLSKIEEGKHGTLSFLSNRQYTAYIYETEATAVIVNKDFVAEKSINTTLIRVDDAYQSFRKLLEIYNQFKNNQIGIDSSASVDETAKLGEEVFIGALTNIGKGVRIGKSTKIHTHCFIGDNVNIGDNCILHAGVRVFNDCIVGNNCTFQANSIIGSDGFGFAPNSDGEYHKVPQIGNVVLEDHVEIGANTTIDRATLGSTVIRKGVKLDNLIQIAHNVEIGENTVIAAQTGIAGSTKIGKNCMIGGQVGIVGHLTIADEVKIAAQSGISSSIKEKGAIIQGSPAFNIGDYKRSYVFYKKLPELYKRIQELEKELTSLREE
ncbi:MAG: UDP-3-O-(3-hydroxymyristoyl)glucosamine N-acyltransferase [Flavobacteriales bacterium]|nr:UDP-3-O-(3-hydroxymyristoyl)glucosamine N-acyltransferase [Flavobacteriales bacterium]|tara:strand:+ start:33 stop:1070 length:1038 start_codon:yes stop_codon:yes gene_type:complete